MTTFRSIIPTLDRRTALKAGGVSLALPMLDAMLPRAAWAGGATPTVPARMMVGHFGTGMNIREFFSEVRHQRLRSSANREAAGALPGPHDDSVRVATGTRWWAHGRL